MKLTAEMIEAALDKWCGKSMNREAYRQDVTAMLEAALDVQPDPVVRPIFWLENKAPRQRECKEWYAETEMGDYWIAKKKRYWLRGPHGHLGSYETLEQAQQRAFASHEIHVRDCLELRS